MLNANEGSGCNDFTLHPTGWIIMYGNLPPWYGHIDDTWMHMYDTTNPKILCVCGCIQVENKERIWLVVKMFPQRWLTFKSPNLSNALDKFISAKTFLLNLLLLSAIKYAVSFLQSVWHWLECRASLLWLWKCLLASNLLTNSSNAACIRLTPWYFRIKILWYTP